MKYYVVLLLKKISILSQHNNYVVKHSAEILYTTIRQSSTSKPSSLARSDWQGQIGEVRLAKSDWRGQIDEVRLARLDWRGQIGEIRLARSDWRGQIGEVRLARSDWRGREWRGQIGEVS